MGDSNVSKGIVIFITWTSVVRHQVADTKGTTAFKEELHRIIVDEKYLPEHVCKANESSLFWKRMPEHTYIHQKSKTMPGFKAFKDYIMPLWGRNVARFKLELFLIYHLENPRAFRNMRKHILPIYCCHKRKAWMTLALFENRFLNSFIVHARECCRQNIQFKILLILDNAPRHPCHITDMM